MGLSVGLSLADFGDIVARLERERDGENVPELLWVCVGADVWVGVTDGDAEDERVIDAVSVEGEGVVEAVVVAETVGGLLGDGVMDSDVEGVRLPDGVSEIERDELRLSVVERVRV